MANDRHVSLLQGDIGAWNQWRKSNPDDRPDLRGADLIGAHLEFADLRRSILKKANLSEAVLFGADLSGADLTDAKLNFADLRNALLLHADMGNAQLNEANLMWANLSGANLYSAELRCSIMVKTNCERTNFSGCKVYGLSVWDVNLQDAQQTDLVISDIGEEIIRVDQIEVAQFVYLVLNNRKIREVVNTIGKRGVLILGRFTERKHVLEAIREEVRKHGLLPMVFDFKRPTDRDFSETVLTLAGMSRFIIADITKPRSVPHELELAVPNFMIPFVPIIQKPDKPYAMFQDLWRKHREWVLNPLSYSSLEQLLRVFESKVIDRANTRRTALIKKKAEELVVLDADEYEE